MLLALLLPLYALAFEDKYDLAVDTSIKAALKQSGVEANFLNIQHAAETRVTKWLNQNGMSGVATAGSIIIPIVYYKQVRVHTGDFTLTGTKDKVELVFQFQW